MYRIAMRLNYTCSLAVLRSHPFLTSGHISTIWSSPRLFQVAVSFIPCTTIPSTVVADRFLATSTPEKLSD